VRGLAPPLQARGSVSAARFEIDIPRRLARSASSFDGLSLRGWRAKIEEDLGVALLSWCCFATSLETQTLAEQKMFALLLLPILLR